MEKKYITEDMHLEKEWFEKAATEIYTPEDLANFAKELFENYSHDYGTLCHAVSALALAGAWLGTHIEGITGFQAGFVMWDFIRNWSFENNKCGLRILDFDDLLYPQYDYHFDKYISSDTWNRVQKAAKEKLEQTKNKRVHPDVRRHWKSIVAGNLPFGFVVRDN